MSKRYISLRKTEFKRLDELLETARLAEGDVAFKPVFNIRYGEIENIRNEFNRLHNLIISEVPEDDDKAFDEQDKLRKTFENAYFLIKSLHSKIFENSQNPTNPVQNQNSSSTTNILTSSNITLPKIELPQFSGDIIKFPSYIDMFDAIIHTNVRLSDIEKFNYLLSSLKGTALGLVQHLPMTSSNYTIAYDTLVKRFKNIRLIAAAHWSAIESVPKLNSDDSSALRQMLDIFNDNLEALKNLKLPVDQWDFILVQMMLKRLDVTIATRFELHHNSTTLPAFASLTDFLQKHCIALDNIHCSRKLKPKKVEPFKPQIASRPSNSFLVQTNNFKCSFCNSDHLLYRCPDFLRKSPSERYKMIKTHKLCINCLSNSHSFKSCKSTTKCHKCNQPHHTLLHFEQSSDRSSASIGNSAENTLVSSSINTEQSASSSVSSIQTAFLSSTSSVLLSTAQVEVLDEFGTYQKLRCLLDSGSMCSFITQKGARRLHLRTTDMTVHLNGLGPMQTLAKHGGVTLSIRPCNKREPIIITDAIVLPSICQQLPNMTLQPGKWSHLSNLDLADPDFHIPSSVDLLLGADVFSRILLDGRIVGRDGEPDVLNTVFGYILTGRINNPSTHTVSSLFCMAEELSLENTVRKFFEVEQVPDTRSISPEDEVCEKMFSDSVTRTPSGRYVVCLPFKDSSPAFPNSRSLALQRFLSLERRLIKQQSLYNQYSDFMQEYLDLGHMEPVTESSPFTYYIPHHCVLKPSSTSTKLRVVFNGSAKLPSQTSLNDHLYIGPKLQRDIVTIILNFRLHSIVFTTDVKMMFRQILVSPTHCDYQRILWRFSQKDPVQDYRLLTITYGLGPSPYLSNRTLLQLADDEGDLYPQAARILREDTYIDDICTGASTLDNALSAQSQLISLMKRGNFELRKWSSNHPTLLSHLPHSHLSVDPQDFDNDTASPLKILGLQWIPSDDCFKFAIEPSNTNCTKRNLLSNLARIFDPLGFLSPVTFLIKHLIQRIWELKLDWDQTPPQDVIRLWEKYLQDLSCLTHFQLPRRLIPDDLSSCELHCFADASEKGYCAVVYLVCTSTSGEVESNFVCSKTKVAPLQKRFTIPKLELSAAVLAAKLVSFVQKIFVEKLPHSKVICWTDSTVTLSWIQSSAHRWKTFVSNRVSFIQNTVPSSSWFHVTSADNPADIGSRGLLPSKLLNNSLWWAGPSFLKDSNRTWTNTEFLPSLEALQEKKILTFTQTLSPHFLENLLSENSSLRTSTRILAYILRFIHNSRYPHDKKLGNLTSFDVHQASLVFARFTQSLFFSDLFSQLKHKKDPPKILRKLSPFIDSRGLIRVGGRLQLAQLAYDKKFPVLLPSRSRFTTLIIEYFHTKYLHAGVQTVHHLISQTFWILSSKRSVRSVLAKCMRCWKTNPTSCQPPMGNLPSSRITQAKPFLHVGVDYAGPFRITMSKTRGSKTLKAYLCLFVCFVTKALHLEVASDLSADAFLAALRRFISRRGRCQHIYSDCGTNFVSAHKQINSFMQSAVSNEDIYWHFNPPSAPNFGGLWESGVKSVKTHFTRVVGEQVLTYEELQTVFIQIEAVLNSRPLTPVSNDPNDFSVLTPGHFLTMEPLVAPPSPDIATLSLNHHLRWKLVQKMYVSFWYRWSEEYLHTLHQRSKWTTESVPVTKDSLVLLKSDNAPPLHWPMGRILEVFPGADGKIRVATVKTQNGVFKRPVSKLCPLPFDHT